jgi:hypothetical protein
MPATNDMISRKKEMALDFPTRSWPLFKTLLFQAIAWPAAFDNIVPPPPIRRRSRDGTCAVRADL